MESVPQDVAEQLKAFDQEHLTRWWPELDEPRREALLEAIRAVDFQTLQALASPEQTSAGRGDRAQAPARVVALDDRTIERDRATALGNAALAAGRVGVILVAGGQGTRLGFPHPKGMFPIGPVSQKSLFQLLAEQVVARARRSGVTIPYYVMTSDATHEETVEFFAANESFGLPQVHFFRQGNMPAIDAATGRVLMSDKATPARSPDGHGGLLQALAQAGLYEQMQRDGVDMLYYHQVDNPTAIVADPELIGFHLQFDSEMTTKVVRKSSPAEKMGVVVELDDETQIIEYSELTPEQSGRKDSQGQWIFWAGNTAIHVFDRAFLERAASGSGLPFHRARKNVPFVDETGRLQSPDDPANPNAVKFERFIFDALPLAKNALVVEADREREFNPVKNREGNDSPDTAKSAISRIGHAWLRAAGHTPSTDAVVEISPLYALGTEDLQRRTISELTGSIYLVD